MVSWSFAKRLFLVCLAWAAFAACPSRAATQVLFVGNSYTYFEGGLDEQLEGLAPSIRTASVVAGGYSLERHRADGLELEVVTWTARNTGNRYTPTRRRTPSVGSSAMRNCPCG